jgi:hypothetical protein
MQQGQPYGGGGYWSSFRAFRFVLIAGSLAVAAVLLARGDELLGLLIGALALARLGYMLASSRRRRSFRGSRGAGPRSGGQMPVQVRELLQGLRGTSFQTAAGVIGLDIAEVRRAFDQGRSLAELAAGTGVPVDRVVNAVVSGASAQIDHDVAAGSLTGENALLAKERLPRWANRLVNFHKGDRPRAGGWR